MGPRARRIREIPQEVLTMPTYVLTYGGGSAEIPASDAGEARAIACKELAYIGFFDKGRLSTADGKRSWDLWYDYNGSRGGIYDWMYSEGSWSAKHVQPCSRPKAGTLGAGGWQGLWLMTDGSIADAQWGDTDSETTLYAIGTVYGNVYGPDGGVDDDLFFPFDESDRMDDVECGALMGRGFDRLLIPADSPDYAGAVDMLDDGVPPNEVLKRLRGSGRGSGSGGPRSDSSRSPGKKKAVRPSRPDGKGRR